MCTGYSYEFFFVWYILYSMAIRMIFIFLFVSAQQWCWMTQIIGSTTTTKFVISLSDLVESFISRILSLSTHKKIVDPCRTKKQNSRPFWFCREQLTHYFNFSQITQIWQSNAVVTMNLRRCDAIVVVVKRSMIHIASSIVSDILINTISNSNRTKRA